MKNYTKFNEQFEEPTDNEVGRFMKQNKINGDIEGFKRNLAALSQEAVGRNREDSFTDTIDLGLYGVDQSTIDKSMGEALMKHRRQQEFIREFPTDEMKGLDLMKKAGLMTQIYDGLGNHVTNSEIRDFITMGNGVISSGKGKQILGFEGEDLMDNLDKLSNSRALEVLDLMSRLGSNSITSSKTHLHIEEDDNGDIQKYAEMRQMSDITRANMIDTLMPNFELKTAKKEVMVRRNHSGTIKSQDIVVLLDDSGSMSDRDKINWVNAILGNRLIEADKGNCNVYISAFENKIYGFQKLELEEGQSVFDFVAKGYGFNGGGTDIESACIETIKQIKSGKLIKSDGTTIDLEGIKPEILVINDGQDYIDANYHPDITINTFCLFQDNEELRNISNRSGGRYYKVTE
jgi:hypothetical protein